MPRLFASLPRAVYAMWCMMIASPCVRGFTDVEGEGEKDRERRGEPHTSHKRGSRTSQARASIFDVLGKGSSAGAKPQLMKLRAFVLAPKSSTGSPCACVSAINASARIKVPMHVSKRRPRRARRQDS